MTFEISKHNGAFVKDRQFFCGLNMLLIQILELRKVKEGGVPEVSNTMTLWINYLLIWKVVSKVITVV